MDRISSKRFWHTFAKVFIVLFVILIILPLIVDLIVDYFSEGTAPKNNSINVFKDLVLEKEVISKFLNTLRRIIYYM